MSHILHKKPKAIILDWDGTLANTRPLVVSAIEKTLSYYALPNWDTTKSEKRDTTKSLKENFPNFFGDKAQEAYQRYLDIYEKSIPTLQMSSGAGNFLLHVKDFNIPVCIVSNKEKSLLLREVEHLFPEFPFHVILGNGDAERNKPHPEPIFKALANTNISTETEPVWIIGDTKQDTECAYASGCTPILIGKGGFMDSAYINKKKASIPPLSTFTDFAHLLHCLEHSYLQFKNQAMCPKSCFSCVCKSPVKCQFHFEYRL